MVGNSGWRMDGLVGLCLDLLGALRMPWELL